MTNQRKKPPSASDPQAAIPTKNYTPTLDAVPSDMSTKLHRTRAYSSARWKKIRTVQLSKEPLCQRCLYYSTVTAAEDVDHVLAHGGHDGLFHDADNLQSLCHSCHSFKTGKERVGQFYSYIGHKEQVYDALTRLDKIIKLDKQTEQST